MKNHDEGLGTVYERFMLNYFFDRLLDTNVVNKVLEVPIYGMTGLTGINSVHFADRGCAVTLMDSRREKIDEATNLWNVLKHHEGKHEILFQEDDVKLPFPDRCFDLVWNFAALWHVPEPELILSEMARVSSNLVLIFMPNKKQLGYQLRKYLFDKDFFDKIDERWAGVDRAGLFLKSLGLNMKDQGVIDVPPWPDTCVSIGPVLEKLKIKSRAKNDRWTWDIMSYYLGENSKLKKKIDTLSFLENMPIPWQIKALWAHHRYVVFSKN